MTQSANSMLGSDTSTSGAQPPSVNSQVARSGQILERIHSAAPGVSDLAIRVGYSLTNLWLRGSGVTCMNFGWASLDGDGIANNAGLAPQDFTAAERFSLQLYDQVAGGYVRDKQVLEVGSGRGGGATFLYRGLGAREVIGIDRTPSSVRWCMRRWTEPAVRFAVGDAEQLSLPGESFDAVVNVESSHCYREPDRFLAEVHRVLRPGGVLLLTDFRTTPEMPVLIEQIRNAGFVIDEDVDITNNVLRALTLTTPERKAARQKLRYRIVHDWADDFIFRLSSGDSEYRRFVARKAQSTV